MSDYRSSDLDTQAPGAPETITQWHGHTMGGGRIPAFMGLAQRTGGVYFESPPSLSEGIKGTDLDFEVRLEQMQANVRQTAMDDHGDAVEIITAVDIPKYRASVAHYNDGRTPVVFGTWQSPRYRPIQTLEALSLGDAMGVDLAAIGAYGDPLGSKVYAAYDLGEFKVGGKDDHNLFLTITTTHDGTGAMTASATPIRFDCTNQTDLYFGKRSVSPKVRIRHVGEKEWNAGEAQRVLGLVRQYGAEYQKRMAALLKQKQTENDFIAWTRQLWDVKDAPTGAAQTREDALVRLLNSDTNSFGKGKAYAGLQAVIEYADFEAPVRGDDKVAARQDRIMVGRVDDLKTRAYESLVAA